MPEVPPSAGFCYFIAYDHLHDMQADEEALT